MTDNGNEDVGLVRSIVEARQLVHALSLEIWDSLAAGHDADTNDTDARAQLSVRTQAMGQTSDSGPTKDG